MAITHLLSDLGNVVFKIDFDLCFRHWSRVTGLPVERIRELAKFDEVYQRHERNEMSGEEYHRHVCRGLGVEFSFVDFANGWSSIYGPIVRQTVDLYSSLRQRGIRLYAMTNSNVLHRETWSLLYAPDLACFEHIFCSSQIGLRKPEPEAFRHVLSAMGATPSQMVFVDDLLENVTGAESVGIRGVLFQDSISSCSEIEALVKKC